MTHTSQGQGGATFPTACWTRILAGEGTAGADGRQAIADVDAARARDPRDAAALFNRGLARRERARRLRKHEPDRADEILRRAISDYEDSIRVDPYLPVTPFHLVLARAERARLLRARGEEEKAQRIREQAVEDAGRAIRLAPTESELHRRCRRELEELTAG